MQRLDAPFLSASGPGFRAAKMNQFSEVIAEGEPQFVTSGRRLKEGESESEIVTLALDSLGSGFYPRPATGGLYAGKHRVIVQNFGPGGNQPISDAGVYHNPNGATATGYWWGYLTDVVLGYTRAFRRTLISETSAVTKNIVQDPSSPSTAPWYYRVATQFRPIASETGNSVFVTGLVSAGQEDLGGVDMPQPIYSVMDYTNWEGDEYFYPSVLLPGPFVRSWEAPMICVVERGCVYALVASRWSWVDDHETDVSARVRLMRSTSPEAGGPWTVWDITDAYRDGMPEEPYMRFAVKTAPPEPPGGGVWLPPLEEDFWGLDEGPRADGLPENASTSRAVLHNVQETAPNSGIWTYTKSSEEVTPHPLTDRASPATYSMNVANTTSIMEPIGDQSCILSYVYMVPDEDNPRGAYSMKYASRMFRFSSSAPEVIFESDEEEFRFFQALKYLGGGRLLAKRTYGFPGTGHAVEFVISEDSGTTWSTLAATGLPEPRENQYFGNFTLVEPWVSPEDQGLVLLPAYDPAAGEYCVYSSRDAGATWKRRGRITKSAEFFRVDTMLVSDGGGNFANIGYYGTRARPAPVNPALPDFMDPP